MKKTYFIKTFNLTTNLFILSILDVIIVFLLKLLSEMLYKSKIQLFLQLTKYPSQASEVLLEIAIGVVFFTLILIGAEFILRFRSDSLFNYFKSIKQTLNLRRFMRQRERSEKIVDSQKVTAYNPINDKFNRSVNKCCVDITQRKIIVFIKVPRTQQTQKILKDLESHIKEEISSQNPEYIFSNFERTHNHLWLQGTKRK